MVIFKNHDNEPVTKQMTEEIKLSQILRMESIISLSKNVII